MEAGKEPPSNVACNLQPHLTSLAHRRRPMAGPHVNARVQRHREALRAAGLRPVQIWVPDTRRPGFDEECRRQSLLVAQADQEDPTIDPSMDEALAEVDGWTA